MKVYGQSFLLAIVVFAVYAQTFSFEFLRFDDQDYTFLCPFVKDGLSWVNVKAAFCSFRHAAIWMPLTYISYMLDISLFGPGMGAHHLVNAAVHAANSALFYSLLTGIFAGMKGIGPTGQEDARTPGQGDGRARLIILGATLFWALHPMRVEPVAWIAGRKELLCAFFVLLGLLAVVKREAGRETRGAGRVLHHSSSLLILLCCLAACMSKPTGMCFPFLAFCAAAMVRTGNGKRGMWNGTALPIATLPIALATGLIAVYSQTHAEGYGVRTLFTAPLVVRVLNAAKSLGMNVIGCDPYITIEGAWHLSRAIQKAADYDEIFAACDYITLHVPATKETTGMINAESIAKMKDGVRIVNLARAELVDSQALIAAVKSGKVASYVTDFITDDLIGADDRIVCIPHLGASTEESEDKCAIMAVREITDYLENGNIKHSVNFPDTVLPHTGQARICLMHRNVAGMLSQISTAVANAGINIENLINRSRGEYAYTIVETADNIPDSVAEAFRSLPDMIRVRIIR